MEQLPIKIVIRIVARGEVDPAITKNIPIDMCQPSQALTARGLLKRIVPTMVLNLLFEFQISGMRGLASTQVREDEVRALAVLCEGLHTLIAIGNYC